MELKNEGNKAVSAHDWVKAIDLYSQAIALDDKQPIFYSNRAQVRPMGTRPVFKVRIGTGSGSHG